MDLNKLEKAAKVLIKIKELDKEIIEIERIAMMVVNSETKSNLELRVTSLEPEPEKKTHVLDEDGSLKNEIGSAWDRINELMMSSLSAPLVNYSPLGQKSKNHSVLEHELSERLTMQILGIILAEKQAIRQGLINKIEHLGIKIQ